ncbi:MAG: Gfo/Idh/MocA family oxidoreductase [Bryobacteraceae bacterium]|nr:Gfo/Idh/MocA family oxidoreductase [Bryobacteraceae bacterium]
MSIMTRRDAARTAGLTAFSYSRIRGANDRIGLGVIGTGSRGTYVMTLFQKNPGVEVRAICDVYGKRIEQALGRAPGAKTFIDHRELLRLKEVDAVLIGSPDHWHKDHSIDAMTAGKDVYVEKPMCRLREEAPLMVRAARANNRICQIGLQQRSGLIYIEALEKFIRSGALGRITQIDAIWHGGVPRPLPKEPVEKPSNLDWIRFLGPVRYRDWVPGQYFNFRAYLDFNGGKITDFGHHWLDTVHMYMGERAPRSAVFAGGIYYDFNDGRTAPDTCNALFEYDGFSVLFQSNVYRGEYGITFHGDQGRLFVNRNRYEFTPAGKGVQPVVREIPGDITADHVRNFLDCCKSRKLPAADAAIAAISVIPPLLAVESYLTKRKLRFDPERLEVLPD